MNTKKKLSAKLWTWRKRILVGTGVLGAVAITVGCGITVYAQTLGGTMTAVGAGAALGAAAGAGMPTAGQTTRGTTGAANDRQRAQNDLINEAGNAGNMGGAGGGTNADGSVTVRVVSQKPMNWGPNSSGDKLVNQLMRGRTGTVRRTRSTRRTRRTPRRQAAYSRRIAAMPPRQRSRRVLGKYQKPPVGYLSWYLKEDRYKVTSKVWQFVTTPNDKFYYYPWAPAMRQRNPARVIGFHTWQDAMIAGYRPDPRTSPTPAPQLRYFAGLTRGPNLERYFELVYAGQITPKALDEHYRYVRYVAGEVGRYAHTRRLTGSTVEQVLGALTGVGEFPTAVGGTVVAKEEAATDGVLPPAGIAGSEVPGAPATATAGGTDKREEDYNAFSRRAGGLAAKPGQ